MSDSAFNYDVAFSFLDAADQALATRLADALRERFRVFIYTERQRELVGKDGVEAFASVFGKESRVVVVLHREAWGSTKWTRVEQDAIRNRAHDLGWDFTVFVPLDEKPRLPPWLPRTRLYFGLQRFGVDGLCAVIEQRIVDVGGEAHPETLEQLAAKKVREREREVLRSTFRGKPGVDWAKEQAGTLLSIAQALVMNMPGFEFTVHGGSDVVEVWPENGPTLTVGWHNTYTNSLEGAGLGSNLWRLHPRSNEARWAREKQEPLLRRRFLPDLGADGQPCWVDDKGREWTLRGIVEQGLKDLLKAMPKP